MTDIPHHSVIVIGGGQAGLSISHYLKQYGVDHAVFEKGEALAAWRDQRWDNFCLVTPNWQCALPGHPYNGPEPDGFMKKAEILAYLSAFKTKVNAPLFEGVAVKRVSRREGGGFRIVTTLEKLLLNIRTSESHGTNGNMKLPAKP